MKSSAEELGWSLILGREGLSRLPTNENTSPKGVNRGYENYPPSRMAAPFIVVSDEPTDARTLDEYGLRFDIEPSKRSEKSGGYQIHTSQLATPEALERLILILAITTLHLTSLGVGIVHAEKRSFRRSALGAPCELFEAWVGVATAAEATRMASLYPFLA